MKRQLYYKKEGRDEGREHWSLHKSSWFFRHILAVVHFNSNLRRETKTNADKSERVKISYPKFKNGEATVRNVTVAQNFGKFCSSTSSNPVLSILTCLEIMTSYIFAAYVQEIYETFLSASKKDITDAVVKLKGMSPPPMNSMLSKQTKQEALKKRSDRKQITIQDVPPSIPGNTFILADRSVLFVMCFIPHPYFGVSLHEHVNTGQI